jgi:hypothetical protein
MGVFDNAFACLCVGDRRTRRKHLVGVYLEWVCIDTNVMMLMT